MFGIGGPEVAAIGLVAVWLVGFFLLVLGILVPFFVWRIHRNVSHTDAMLEQLYPQIIRGVKSLEELARKPEPEAATQATADEDIVTTNT